MKRQGNLSKLAPLLLAGCVGGAATVWSPISCSCLSAWYDIATGLGRRDVTGPDQLTASFLANAISDEFSGKVVKARDLPYATSTSDCVDSPIPAQAVRCTWWLWESGTKKKGYSVLIQTNHDGMFQRALVTQKIADV